MADRDRTVSLEPSLEPRQGTASFVTELYFLQPIYLRLYFTSGLTDVNVKNLKCIKIMLANKPWLFATFSGT